MKWTILFRGKSYAVRKRYYWLAIDDDGEFFVYVKKPGQGRYIDGWMPRTQLSAPGWARSACFLGITKPPKTWETAIYRLEREK